jgi:hypothetical protein
LQKYKSLHLLLQIFSLRIVGDRNISEDDFRKIQTDRVSEMQNWANILGRSQEEDKGIKLAIVALTITMLNLNLEPHIYSVSRELGAKIGERPFRIF